MENLYFGLPGDYGRDYEKLDWDNPTDYRDTIETLTREYMVSRTSTFGCHFYHSRFKTVQTPKFLPFGIKKEIRP
jgi:hypothetical protein